MLSPEIGQTGFRLALFITLLAGGLLFFVQPGTAEFVITVATFVIGLVFLLLIVALVWRADR